METDHWPRGCFSDNSEGPPPSEMESNIRMIVQKQMDTKITLTSQFGQHRDFCDAGELRVLSASTAGLHSAQELESLDREAEGLAKLARAGMSKREIAFYLQATQGLQHIKDQNEGKYSCEPGVLQRRLREMREQVARSEELRQIELQPQLATQAGACTASCPSKKPPKDPFSYIAEFAKRLDARKKRRRNKKQVEDVHKTQGETDGDVIQQVDLSLWHAVVPLAEDDVSSNRLSLKEIWKIPRFSDYAPGEPHSVLYLKNIHPKVNREELIAIFSRFDKADTSVEYRLLTGRMRGQAFLHFPDVDAATRALQFANGYQLRGRPIIITFAKKKEPTKSEKS